MKKKKIILKSILIIIMAIILFIAIDIFSILTFNNKPIIIINESETKKSSILYDVYECNNKKIIKVKGSKFICQKEKENSKVDIKKDEKNITIKDTSKGKLCADAIEYYYKNYYFICVKSQYVIVTVNGIEYNIKDALNNGIVTMDELIKAGFTPLGADKELQKEEYKEDDGSSDEIINEKPIEISEEEKKTITNNEIKKSIIITDNSKGKPCPSAIEYYYQDYYFTCVKSPYIIITVNDVKYNIKDALNNNVVTMDELIDAGFNPVKSSDKILK